MSGSKVLRKMWGDMRSNFEELLVQTAKEDKLPQRSVLENYQASVQDLIDIFDAVDGGQAEGSPSVEPPNSAQKPVDEPSEKESAHVWRQKHKSSKLTKKEKAYIWSVYEQNHKQFLSDAQFKSLAKELHRQTFNLKDCLLQMISTARNVSVEQTQREVFTAQEDSRIWSHYTNNVSDSYNSEGEIIASLSRDLNRPTTDILNRLRWLKANDNHKGTKAATPNTKSAPRAAAYTPQEDHFVQDETLTNADVAQIIGRTEDAVRNRRRKKFHIVVRKPTWRRKHPSTTRTTSPEDIKPSGNTPDDAGSSDSSETSDTSNSDTSTYSEMMEPPKPPQPTTGASGALWFEDGRFSNRPAPVHRHGREVTPEPRFHTAEQFERDLLQRQAAVRPQAQQPPRHPSPINLMDSSESSNESSTQEGRRTAIQSQNEHRSPPRTIHHPAPPHLPPEHVMDLTATEAEFRQPHESGSGHSGHQSAPRSEISPDGVDAYEKAFLAQLNRGDMTVLQPQIRHDQVLALVLGLMLYHNHQPLSYWGLLFPLRKYLSADGKLLPALPELSHSKLNKVLSLLRRAGCLQYTVGQMISLDPRISDFDDLRRHHDRYLQSQMGRDARRLQHLLWPEAGPERTYMLEGMGKLVETVKSAVARRAEH